MLLSASNSGHALFHAAFHMTGSNVHNSHLVNCRTVRPSTGHRLCTLDGLFVFWKPLVIELLHGDGCSEVIRILVIFHQSGISVVIGGKV